MIELLLQFLTFLIFLTLYLLLYNKFDSNSNSGRTIVEIDKIRCLPISTCLKTEINLTSRKALIESPIKTHVFNLN